MDTSLQRYMLILEMESAQKVLSFMKFRAIVMSLVIFILVSWLTFLMSHGVDRKQHV